jgi:hypothetical protein
MSRSRTFFSFAAFIGPLFYLYYGIYKMLFVNYENLGTAFRLCYFAAQSYLEGRPVYDTGEGDLPFLYPPLALIVFIPFHSLSPKCAVILWFIINHILILFSAWMIFRIGRAINRENSMIAAVAAFFLSLPLYHVLFVGNINIVIFTIACLSYYFIFSGGLKSIPWLLSFCSYLKVFPALWMIVFVRNKKWKLIRNFLIALIALGGISLFLFGLDQHVRFMKNLPQGIKWLGPFQAMSFSFVMKSFLNEASDKTVMICNLLFGLSLLAIWWSKAHDLSSEANEKSKIAADFSILSVLTVLVVPYSWMHYHIFFIVPFYFILFSWLQDRYHLKFIGLFFILFFLISFWEIIIYQLPLSGNGLTMMSVWENKGQFPILHRVIFSLPFVFNLVFFGWLIANYNRLKKALQIFY